jgi:hypothetical protein
LRERSPYAQVLQPVSDVDHRLHCSHPLVSRCVSSCLHLTQTSGKLQGNLLQKVAKLV